MLLMLGVDALQLELSSCFTELHVDPAMGMAFAKIIADGWLVNKMEMVTSSILPLMGMAIEIASGMLSLGK